MHTLDPKLRFWTLFGLRGALFGDSGAPRGQRPRGTLFTLFGLFWGSGREGPGSTLRGRGVFRLLPWDSILLHGPVGICLDAKKGWRVNIQTANRRGD